MASGVWRQMIARDDAVAAMPGIARRATANPGTAAERPVHLSSAGHTPVQPRALGAVTTPVLLLASRIRLHRRESTQTWAPGYSRNQAHLAAGRPLAPSTVPFSATSRPRSIRPASVAARSLRGSMKESSRFSGIAVLIGSEIHVIFTIVAILRPQRSLTGPVGRGTIVRPRGETQSLEGMHFAEATRSPARRSGHSGRRGC